MESSNLLKNKSYVLLDEYLFLQSDKSFRNQYSDLFCGDIITKGFSDVDEFVKVANMVLNRRKSRAGKSLEHHLAAIFDGNAIQYSAQAVTEGNKKPDFISVL